METRDPLEHALASCQYNAELQLSSLSVKLNDMSFSDIDNNLLFLSTALASAYHWAHSRGLPLKVPNVIIFISSMVELNKVALSVGVFTWLWLSDVGKPGGISSQPSFALISLTIAAILVVSSGNPLFVLV